MANAERLNRIQRETIGEFKHDPTSVAGVVERHYPDFDGSKTREVFSLIKVRDARADELRAQRMERAKSKA